MRLTRIGSDYITIDENNIEDKELLNIPRVHLIKFDFSDPTEEKIKKVIELYPKTNRFVIDDNIRLYNYVLRGTSKKYYIENKPETDLITFFRKNNKVLLNFGRLREEEYRFVSDFCLLDVLRNTEVVQLDKPLFEEKREHFEKWSGNVIIQNGL